MKCLLVSVLLFLICFHTFAQSVETKAETPDTTKKQMKDGEIKLSGSFLKALEGAFTFGPQQAPMTKRDDLTVEQLHEWVGAPSDAYAAKRTEKFDSAYKALKMWEKEFYQPIEGLRKSVIEIPGLKVGSGGAHGLPSFDTQALSKYIRPKERRLYKVRKMAEKHLQDLDTIIPVLKDDIR